MTRPAGQLLTTEQKLDVIRRYYDACSIGDVDALVETVCDDVVHYFLAPNPGSAPVSGALCLARYWRKAQARTAGCWIVDRILGEGDEAVIEWTLFWQPPAGADRVATRGAEWYRFEAGRIAEIRAYYQQLQVSTELEAFDYAGRGYSRLGSEASELHGPAGAGADA
jgi:ketosteroid isomerase-like protein